MPLSLRELPLRCDERLGHEAAVWPTTVAAKKKTTVNPDKPSKLEEDEKNEMASAS